MGRIFKYTFIQRLTDSQQTHEKMFTTLCESKKKKKNSTNEPFPKQKLSPRYRKPMVTKEEMQGRDKLWNQDWHMYSIICKIDKNLTV